MKPQLKTQKNKHICDKYVEVNIGYIEKCVCIIIDAAFSFTTQLDSMSTSGLRLLIQSSSGVLLSFTRQDRPERMHVKLRPQEFWQGSMRHKTHGRQYCQHALHITACALHLLKVLDNQYKIRTDASQPIVVRWSKDWLGAWRASRYFKIFHYHWIAEHWAFWRAFAYLCHNVVSIQWCLPSFNDIPVLDIALPFITNPGTLIVRLQGSCI